jgi:hypothetical protein
MNLSALHWLIRESVVRGVPLEHLDLVPARIGAQPFGSLSTAERAALRAWQRLVLRSGGKLDEPLPRRESFEWI